MESALLILFMSDGCRVRIGMKYGCGSAMAVTEDRPGPV